jgi:hypothetical protein
MSCESRISGHSLTSSQLILRRRVVHTAVLYETECSRNYATEISRLTTLNITLVWLHPKSALCIRLEHMIAMKFNFVKACNCNCVQQKLKMAATIV